MPTTTAPVKDHQSRWDEIASDSSLRDLPYKVETNHRGQIVLSPHTNHRSLLQEQVQDLLDDHAPEGYHPPGLAIATPEGVKVPDVIWMSPKRWEEMQATGDPSTLAPEICIGVLSSSNTEEEIKEKRALYREAGAEEVWIVDRENQIHFFGNEDLDRSRLAPSLAPNCPDQVPEL